MEIVAYVIFLCIVCAVYRVLVIRAKKYGERLKKLRQICKKASNSEEFTTLERESERIVLVVINKDTDDSVLSETNEDDELIWIHIKAFKSFQVEFPHVPDLQNVYSQKIAVYKIERKNHVFFTYMSI